MSRPRVMVLVMGRYSLEVQLLAQVACRMISDMTQQLKRFHDLVKFWHTLEMTVTLTLPDST